MSVSKRRAVSLSAAMAVALAGALVWSPALAAAPTAQDRDAARALASEGVERFEAHDYDKALAAFRGAEARYHAPPHLLYVARCLVKLERLLEARAAYEEVSNEKLGVEAPPPFREAVASAQHEKLELEKVTPALTLSFVGATAPGVSVTLDGQPVSLDDVGKPLRQNPGKHVVEAKAPGLGTFTQTVKLQLGTPGERVAIDFTPPGRQSAGPAIAAFCVGGAGLVAGITGAVLASGAKPNDAKRPRIAEITGFAAAGAGALTGVVLLAAPPKATPNTAALSDVWLGVGVGAMTLRGRF